MRWIVPALFAGSAIVAIACGTFGSDDDPEPAPPGSDAGGDGEGDGSPSPNDDGSAPADARADGASGFDLDYRAACPRPAAPAGSCVALGSCKRPEIFRPPSPEHPWGIAVDAHHVYWLAFPAGVDGYNGNGAAVLRRLDRATKEVVEIARDQVEATTLYANGPHLYWVATAGSRTELRVMRKDVPPCGATACAGSMQRIAFNGIARVTHMAMPSPDTLFVVHENGAVTRVALASGATTTVATTSEYAGLVGGDGEVFATGAKQTAVVRIPAIGSPVRMLGSLTPRDSGAGFVGASFLATDCTSVFALALDDTIDRLPIAADGGTFAPFAALPSMDVYGVASDARFLYVGAANGGGLVVVDTTSAMPSPVRLANGSAWRLAVADDVIAYGEHGSKPSDMAAGAIFLIEK